MGKEREEEEAICSALFIHEAACALFYSLCSSNKVASQHASHRMEQQCGRALKPFPQRLIVCLSHPQIAARHLGSNMVTGRKCHLCFSRFWLFTRRLLSSKLLAPSYPDLTGCSAELITALWSFHERFFFFLPLSELKEKGKRKQDERQLAVFLALRRSCWLICLGFVALCPPREKLKAHGVHLLPLDLSEPDCKIAGEKKKKDPLRYPSKQ